mmetsp:Transcript_14457/g.23444  ORF Transcript_14457/g.23444 Transcript_14457/m.23444 type:complete len:204 (-) Transcript_14457:542-1153(-)
MTTLGTTATLKYWTEKSCCSYYFYRTKAEIDLHEVGFGKFVLRIYYAMRMVVCVSSNLQNPMTRTCFVRDPRTFFFVHDSCVVLADYAAGATTLLTRSLFTTFAKMPSNFSTTLNSSWTTKNIKVCNNFSLHSRAVSKFLNSLWICSTLLKMAIMSQTSILCSCSSPRHEVDVSWQSSYKRRPALRKELISLWRLFLSMGAGE